MTTLTARPNAWVTVEDPPTTKLLYGPRVHPSPLTTSASENDPTLGSLEVVITNATAAAVNVDSIAFTVAVGSGAALTPSTQGIKWEVSDPTDWQVRGPQTNPPITSGTVQFELLPVSGNYVTLAAGASVTIQIYDFTTIAVAATTTVQIKETIDGAAANFTSFAVTTFPEGFYFDGLIATVPSASALVPVAQVAVNTPVTLTWNSSVVDSGACKVLYSSATGGQQEAHPTELGKWTSPPLTSDTVFVVVITATVTGGASLPMALATAVAVQNPALVAGSLHTGGLSVSGAAAIAGALSANAITATGVAVNGPLSASAATVNGALSASSGTINGALTANGITVNGAANVSGSVSAGGTLTSASGTSSLAALNTGGITAGVISGYGGIWRIGGNGNAVNGENASNTYCCAYFYNTTGHTANYVSGVGVKVANSGDWGFGTNGRMSSASALVTHVETRNGHRVVTSPLCLEPEVHVSGHGRLSRGRAVIELEPEASDMVLHAEGAPYQVQITPTSPCNGLMVSSKEANRFTVEELLDGASDAEFDWLMIARKPQALGSPEPDALPAALPEILAAPTTTTEIEQRHARD